jgi:2-polyprenyl-3-methyl-5-hydroxy-6-metoxy-1,4-benzoquinol methylase
MTTEIILDSKERFAFGKNWHQFLKHFDESRVQEAEKSLQEKLGLSDLTGKTFLDIGSGSGLFSLAAHRLGARVYSFDYDQDSVDCTLYLKKNYARNNLEWSVEQGSVLDQTFLNKFGQVDIFYSWGVLHHTGHMFQAFENVSHLVKDAGILFISVYNDQGRRSRYWKTIKKSYIQGNILLKMIILFLCIIGLWGIIFLKDFLTSLNPLKTWFSYGKNNRGMSAWHDLIDWVGGYPFEVAKPEVVFAFFNSKGFQLEKLKTCAGGLGCNEFVFVKKQQPV